MHQDFKELLSVFNAGQVRYLIVGGYAVSFHAQPRATKDLDILIGADTENSKAVFAALAKFGTPVEGLNAKDFAEPDSFFRMGTPPGQFQKQLRLHCARRKMLTDELDAASAAFQVGYESPSQFNREYKRFFGKPPIRDIQAQRGSV
jgi:hypothetical protein